jgi:hypothetical protein
VELHAGAVPVAAALDVEAAVGGHIANLERAGVGGGGDGGAGTLIAL